MLSVENRKPRRPCGASFLVVRPERLELPTRGLGNRCSILLSYGRASLITTLSRPPGGKCVCGVPEGTRTPNLLIRSQIRGSKYSLAEFGTPCQVRFFWKRLWSGLVKLGAVLRGLFPLLFPFLFPKSVREPLEKQGFPGIPVPIFPPPPVGGVPRRPVRVPPNSFARQKGFLSLATSSPPISLQKPVCPAHRFLLLSVP